MSEDKPGNLVIELKKEEYAELIVGNLTCRFTLINSGFKKASILFSGPKDFKIHRSSFRKREKNDGAVEPNDGA